MYSIVFYPFPSFFQYFPSWNVRCFANGAWSFRHRGSLDPQTTETTDSTTSGDWDDWEAMESAAMAAMECEYQPMLNPKVERSWKIKHWNALEWYWKLKHTEAELQVAVQVWLSSHETSTCCNRRLQKSSEDSENLQPSALWDPLLCLLRFPDAPKGLKTRGCLVQCLDVSWCEISRNPTTWFSCQYQEDLRTKSTKWTVNLRWTSAIDVSYGSYGYSEVRGLVGKRRPCQIDWPGQCWTQWTLQNCATRKKKRKKKQHKPIGSMVLLYMVTLCNMDPINIPAMLAYIPAPWILWERPKNCEKLLRKNSWNNASHVRTRAAPHFTHTRSSGTVGRNAPGGSQHNKNAGENGSTLEKKTLTFTIVQQ